MRARWRPSRRSRYDKKKNVMEIENYGSRSPCGSNNITVEKK